jgi:hypothetical protein
MVENWSSKTQSKEESKFEIKLAKDINTKLDEVKGIDEI